MTDPLVLCYRRLAAAIIKRAVLDAQSSNGTAAAARRWLECDPFAAYLAESLGLDVRRVKAWVGELEPEEQLSFEI